MISKLNKLVSTYWTNYIIIKQFRYKSKIYFKMLLPLDTNNMITYFLLNKRYLNIKSHLDYEQLQYIEYQNKQKILLKKREIKYNIRKIVSKDNINLVLNIIIVILLTILVF